MCALKFLAAPFSDIYRGMALIGVKGFGALPKHCATLMLAFFLGGAQQWLHTTQLGWGPNKLVVGSSTAGGWCVQPCTASGRVPAASGSLANLSTAFSECLCLTE